MDFVCFLRKFMLLLWDFSFFIYLELQNFPLSTALAKPYWYFLFNILFTLWFLLWTTGYLEMYYLISKWLEITHFFLLISNLIINSVQDDFRSQLHLNSKDEWCLQQKAGLSCILIDKGQGMGGKDFTDGDQAFVRHRPESACV